MTLLLTPDELQALTGTKQAKRQADWLKARGWQFEPAILQPDRETAEREAMRLAQTKGAGKVFVIFEAVAAARMVTIHSHTTLGGKLTGEQLLPRVLDLGEDDGIPF